MSYYITYLTSTSHLEFEARSMRLYCGSVTQTRSAVEQMTIRSVSGSQYRTNSRNPSGEKSPYIRCQQLWDREGIRTGHTESKSQLWKPHPSLGVCSEGPPTALKVLAVAKEELNKAFEIAHTVLMF